MGHAFTSFTCTRSQNQTTSPYHFSLPDISVLPEFFVWKLCCFSEALYFLFLMTETMVASAKHAATHIGKDNSNLSALNSKSNLFHHLPTATATIVFSLIHLPLIVLSTLREANKSIADKHEHFLHLKLSLSFNSMFLTLRCSLLHQTLSDRLYCLPCTWNKYGWIAWDSSWSHRPDLQVPDPVRCSDLEGDYITLVFGHQHLQVRLLRAWEEPPGGYARAYWDQTSFGLWPHKASQPRWMKRDRDQVMW